MQVTIPQTSGNPIIALVVGILENAIYLDKFPGTPAAGNVTFTRFIKHRIVGGWDVHDKNYVVSIQEKTTDINKHKNKAIS